jgi:hypothetical protein|tara:strand:- start:3687 stop:3971 length:285 start_codon:yes stop_codon:yes gene_type:complete
MKTIKKIKTYSMTSPRTGNPVANQFEIYTPEGKYFQSYRSIIAFVDKFGQIMLDEYYHNYSRTTSKYLTQFLDMNTKERTNAIKNKEITLTNLN